MKSKRTTQSYNLRAFFSNKGLFFRLDIIVLIIVLVALSVSIIFILKKEAGSYVEVYFRGDLKQTYSINENRTVDLSYDGHNTLVIENRTVYISEADCSGKQCTEFAPISYVGQRIVCAPNGIVVIIVGKGEIDGITGGYYAD